MNKYEEKPKEGISKYADIVYLTDEVVQFYKTDGGFVGLKFGGNDYEKVSIYRMFPLSYAWEYLSVRDKDEKEIGVIRDLTQLSDTAQELVKSEVSRRYFVPIITSVLDVKEEFNYTFWECETSAGVRSFVVFDMNHSVIVLGKGRVQLVDVDGNRYEIPDVSALSAKALKLVEIWL